MKDPFQLRQRRAASRETLIFWLLGDGFMAVTNRITSSDLLGLIERPRLLHTQRGSNHVKAWTPFQDF